MGPGDLEQVISRLPLEETPELLTSINTGEDAGVYLIGEDLALVQTVDFFPPIVDDPRTFGRIAAANALSDIYAMGAKPLTAMNIIAFPCALGLEVLEEILLGGYEKVRESGAVMLGGHTIEDREPKYGLSVTGTVRPSEMKRIDTARPGDLLVLTKPLGTGVLVTALKAGFIGDEEMAPALESMRSLNRYAAERLKEYDVSACTDVTGFGLVGHLYEMVRSSGVSAELWVDEVPLFPGTLDMASMGMIPAGLYRNIDYVGDRATRSGSGDPPLFDVMFDPQTSGGLLAALAPAAASDAAGRLVESGADAKVIGRILEEPGGKILLEMKRSG